MSRYTRVSSVRSLCVTFMTGREWVSRYTRVSSVRSLCVTFMTGRQWVSRYTRFSSVGSLCVTFSDWETMGVLTLYEVFLC